MNTLVVVLLISIVLFCMCSKKEKFVEIFGSTGYKKPVDNVEVNYDINFDDSDFEPVDKSITHDDLNKCVIPTIELIRKETGICAVPVETNNITLLENSEGVKLFKCRFMMMVKNTGFPFGFGISVIVLDGKIVSASTQPLENPGDLSGYNPRTLGDNFLPASEILPKPKSL